MNDGELLKALGWLRETMRSVATGGDPIDSVNEESATFALQPHVRSFYYQPRRNCPLTSGATHPRTAST
jgi:hypothetical protein